MGLKKAGTDEYARISELRVNMDFPERSRAYTLRYPSKVARDKLGTQMQDGFVMAQSDCFELGTEFATALGKLDPAAPDLTGMLMGAAYSAVKGLGEFKGAETWEDVLDDSVPAAAPEVVKW